jgi:putative addiction module killer protein
MKPVKILRLYKLKNGKVPYQDWLSTLDRPIRARISARVDRVANGNFGVCHPVGQGVKELCLDFGPGYRIYFTEQDSTIVVLLLAGNKSRQQKDIEKAHEYFNDFMSGGNYEDYE